MTLSLLFLIQEAEHLPSAGRLPAPFSPTAGLFIWTIVVFLVLLVLLTKYVYPPLVKMTADREETINRQLAEALRLQEEAKGVLEEQRGLLAGARGEATAIVAEARDAAERERATAVARTRAEQDDILAKAKHEIAADGQRARDDLRREAVDIAIAAASKVVEARLDAASDRKIVEEYLTEIGKQA